MKVSTIAATSSAAPADRNATRAVPRRRIPAHAAMTAARRIAAMTRPRGNDSTAASTATTAAGGEEGEGRDRQEASHVVTQLRSGLPCQRPAAAEA